MSEKKSNKKIQNNDSEIDNMDFSYLYRKGQDEDTSYRDFPKMGKAERITNIVLHSIGFAGFICFLVCALYYGISNTTSFKGQDGYGIGGIVAIVLISVAGLALIAYSLFYKLKYAETKSHDLQKAIYYSLFYVMIGALYTGFALIPLRGSNIEAYQLLNGGVYSYMEYLLLGLVCLFIIAAIVLNFVLIKKNPKTLKTINYVMLAILLWVIVCFYPIMAKTYAVGKTGMALVIVASVVMDLSLIFLASGKKKTGYHTAFNFLTFAAFALDAVAIFYYGMIAAV